MHVNILTVIILMGRYTVIQISLVNSLYNSKGMEFEAVTARNRLCVARSLHIYVHQLCVCVAVMRIDTER